MKRHPSARAGARAALGAATAAALLLAGVGTAHADNLTNELMTGGPATNGKLSLSPTGSSRSVDVWLVPTNDVDNNCNLDSSSDYVTFSVASSNTNAATVSPSVTLTGGCGSNDSSPITVTPVAVGTTVITFTKTATSEVDQPEVFDTSTATFTVYVDDAPTVTATSPANGATNVAVGANVTITFNEPVTLDNNWANLSCTTSGAHATAISGSNANWTLNPTVDFDAGETCTVGVVANKVTDTDTIDGPDNTGMPSNYSFSFTTASAPPPPPPADTTAPTIGYTLTPPAPDGNNGWYKSAVALDWTVTDAESAFTATGCVDTTVTDDQAATDYSCSATSAGGSAGPVTVTLKKDGTAPTVAYTSASPTPNVNGWFKVDVEATFTATDATSGFAGGMTQTGTSTTSGEGAAVTADSPLFTDLAGNEVPAGSATSPGFKIDKTAPTVALLQTDPASPNAAGWFKTDVTATFRGTDSLAGFTGPSLTSDKDATSSGEGDLITIDSPAFTDLADNQAPVGTATAGPYKIDKTAPTVTVTGVSATQYTLGSVPTAGCSTTDALSGVDTEATAAVTGGTPNGVGTFTATCSGGTDVAGNTAAPVTVEYTVVYGGLSGIQQPINPDNTSVFKRGQALPVKFRLAGDEGTGFGTTGWKIKPIQVSCTAFDTLDASIEDVPSNTPAAYFRYDASADQYIYNADMKAQTVGTCWRFSVTLDSNQSMQSAVFKLAK